MKLPWSKSDSPNDAEGDIIESKKINQPLMTNSSKPPEQKILKFGGKRYELNTLPDDTKELVRGMQVAEAQVRMHEDTLKVLALGRQSMGQQLNEKLKDLPSLPEEKEE